MEHIFTCLVVSVDMLDDVKFETHDVLKVDVPMLVSGIPDSRVQEVFGLLGQVLVVQDAFGLFLLPFLLAHNL